MPKVRSIYRLDSVSLERIQRMFLKSNFYSLKVAPPRMIVIDIALTAFFDTTFCAEQINAD